MKEQKTFFEVFPDFTCVGELKEMFEQVIITDATMVKSEKTLKFKMISKILIATSKPDAIDST